MPNAVPAIEEYRAYLVARARLQLAARPWLTARLDASDLVHDVMVKAHAARETFRGQSPGELVAWLHQILNRTLANVLRTPVGAERSLEANLDASSCRLDAWLAADQTSPSERAQNHERATTLAAAVDALPDDQRAVVLLKHCQGLTLAEIATQTERTPAAVAGLLRRGLARLRELLGEGDNSCA
jgi:RNA polymerase sigma-70 factor (ECF subfamily)